MVQSNLQLSPASASSDELTYARLLSTIWRRRFWFFPIFLGSVGLSVLASFVLKPTYETTMQFLLEPTIQAPKNRINNTVRPEQAFTDPTVEIDYATQINLMRSPEILQQLINRVHSDYPDLELEDLQKVLRVEQLTEQQDGTKIGTKVVRVTYTDKDPIKTQRVLKVLQGIYQEYNLKQQSDRLNQGMRFINQQVPVVQKRLMESESALEQFRKRNNLIDPETQSKNVTEALNKIQDERRDTISKYQEASSRFQDVKKQVGNSPEAALAASRVTESKRYQENLNELQKVEFELAQKQAQFTDDSPAITDLKDRRQRILSLLPEEMRRIMGSKTVQGQNGEALLSQGQMGSLDIKLVDQLLAANTDLKAFSARDQVLSQSEQDLRQQLNKFPALMAEYGRLEPAVKMHRELLQKLLSAQQDLGMDIARGGLDWKVLESPQLGKNVGPSLLRNLAMGIVVGLFLGGLVAFFRDMSDDAVHTSDDLRRNIDVPLLGMIPELPKVGDKILPQEVFAVSKLPPGIAQLIHWAPFRESMDLIYQNLQMAQRSAPKSIVMTSALPKEGKSTLSLGLVMSAARLNHRVLVIDADLRNPSLHQKLDMPNGEGLSTILTNPSQNVQPQEFELTNGCKIDVLTAGPIAGDPPKLLSSPQWRELIRFYETQYDLVVVDAPPVLGMVDTLMMASVCEGVVMTGRMSVVTRSELNEALDTLSQFNVMGVIANGMERKAAYYEMEKRSPTERLASLAEMASITPLGSALPASAKPQVNLAGNSMSSQEMQQRVHNLEATIYKMTSFIQQQQDELESHAWTIDDLRSRLKKENGNSTSNSSIREELDYAQDQYNSLEQSVKAQQETLQEQQRVLDAYYENLMKSQRQPQTASLGKPLNLPSSDEDERLQGAASDPVRKRQSADLN